jgi:HK97 family phage portal protein
MSMESESRIYDVTPEMRFFGSLLDDDYGFARGASSGVRVTSENALQSTTVLACIRVLAETVASLPLHLFRNLPAGGRERSPGWLDSLLSVSPNGWQTSFEWLETCMIHLGLYGACYSEIVEGNAGVIKELIPLHPSRMKTEMIENGRLRFTYTEPNGGKTVYNQDQIFRVLWMSSDGVTGSVPVQLGKEAIGLARACELHGSRYFGNGARPGVVLETDSNMAVEAAERLRENWERLHRGPDKSSKTAVLTGGLKAHELGMSNTESQFLDARRFQVEEVCRLYRCPPHMIQDLTRSTFSNIEQQSIDFVQYSILPWLRRFEKAFARDLIPQPELYFAAFDVSYLMRGDSAARSAYFTSMIDRGIMSINEVRSKENLNPIKGGDSHYFPLNMTTVEAMADGIAGEAETPAPQAELADEPNVEVAPLLQVLEAVSQGLLLADAAAVVISASFPNLSPEQVASVIAGVRKPAPLAVPLLPAPRSAPDAVDTGDFVSWGSGDGRGRGRITRVVRDGEINVPDSSFTITGTEDDPAALIRVYRESAEGWNATDTLVGHRFSTLTKIDPLEGRKYDHIDFKPAQEELQVSQSQVEEPRKRRSRRAKK